MDPLFQICKLELVVCSKGLHVWYSSLVFSLVRYFLLSITRILDTSHSLTMSFSIEATPPASSVHCCIVFAEYFDMLHKQMKNTKVARFTVARTSSTDISHWIHRVILHITYQPKENYMDQTSGMRKLEEQQLQGPNQRSSSTSHGTAQACV